MNSLENFYDSLFFFVFLFFFQAEDGIRDAQESRGLGDVYKRQVHAGDPNTAAQLVDEIRRRFRVREIIITELSLPVASHLGQGTVGIVAYPVPEER